MWEDDTGAVHSSGVVGKAKKIVGSAEVSLHSTMQLVDVLRIVLGLDFDAADCEHSMLLRCLG